MSSQTLDEIRIAGLEALARELGPVKMVRFLQQYENGRGNYSVEREQWLNQAGDVRDISEQIHQRRRTPLDNERE